MVELHRYATQIESEEGESSTARTESCQTAQNGLEPSQIAFRRLQRLSAAAFRSLACLRECSSTFEGNLTLF